jgi:DNA-binding response OmpR family regulator
MAPISKAMLEILDRLDLEVHLASGEHEALEILCEKEKKTISDNFVFLHTHRPHTHTHTHTIHTHRTHT